MPRTNWNDMADYSIPLPGERVAKAYSELIQPWLDKMLSTIHESRFLCFQRDALLPKLVSGKVRVEDADKFLKAVKG